MKNLFLLLIFCLISTLTFSQKKNEQLFKAVSQNDLKKVEKLLEQNADVNYISDQGWVKVNLLITAVNNENFEIVKKLVEHKANVNWSDGFKTTALMYSASKGNYEISKYLIDNGANVQVEDEQGNSVLIAANEGKNIKLITLIKDKLSNSSEYISAEELIKLGDEFCRDKEDYENGIIYYTKALQKVQNAEIFIKRGGAYFALKKFDNAVLDFSDAIKTNPEDISNIYFMRGLSKSLLEKEDKEGACEDFQKAKKLGYDFSELNGLNEYCGVKNLQ